MEQEHYTNSLRDFLTVLFKHKLKILTVFAAGVIIITAVTFRQTPDYTAESTLMIQVGREYIFRPEVGDTKPTLRFNPGEVINSDIQILYSTDLIEKAIINLGVENIYPDLVEQPPERIMPLQAAVHQSKYQPLVKQPPERIMPLQAGVHRSKYQPLVKQSPEEITPLQAGVHRSKYQPLVKQSPEEITPLQAAIRRFKSQLSVDAVKNSNILKVSFKHQDQQVPAPAVNQLVECFKERHIQIFSNSQSAFLEKQLTVHRQRLRESENNLDAFKQKNRVFSLPEQRTLLLGQHSNLDTSLKKTQNRIIEMRQKISSITSQMQQVSENIPVSDQTAESKNIGGTQGELLALQLEEKDLRTKYDESDPMLAMVREKIELVKDFLAEQEESSSQSVTIGKNNVYTAMEIALFQNRAELSSQEANRAAIKQQLHQLDGEIQDLDAKGSELRSLERELDSDERNYQTYLTKLEEARISDEMDRSKMANIKVIQKAEVPLGPVPTKNRLKFGVGIILAAASGLALALFSEYIIEQGISTPEGVTKRLGLPVLATVPDNGKKKITGITPRIHKLYYRLEQAQLQHDRKKTRATYQPTVVREPSFIILNVTYRITVRPDGRMSLQSANEVMAAGLTPAELTDILTEINCGRGYFSHACP